MDIVIRRWRKKDAADLANYANNFNVWKNLRDYFPHPYTEQDANWWIDKTMNEEPLINFAIDADGSAVGGISIVLKEDVYKKSAELGYWVGEPFWKKGIATEAVRQITEYSFNNFDIVRLSAEIFESNRASMKVLEKNGFYLEAIQKKAVYKNNVLMDSYVWVKLKS